MEHLRSFVGRVPTDWSDGPGPNNSDAIAPRGIGDSSLQPRGVVDGTDDDTLARSYSRLPAPHGRTRHSPFIKLRILTLRVMFEFLVNQLTYLKIGRVSPASSADPGPGGDQCCWSWPPCRGGCRSSFDGETG